MAAFGLAAVIDIEKYPIHDLDGDICLEVLKNCRVQLQNDGSCVIPGFIRKDLIIESFCAEVSDLPDAFVRNEPLLAKIECMVDHLHQDVLIIIHTRSCSHRRSMQEPMTLYPGAPCSSKYMSQA